MFKAETLHLFVLKGTVCNQTKENGGDTGRDGVNENKNQKRWKLLSGSLLRIPLNHKATDAFKVIKKSSVITLLFLNKFNRNQTICFDCVEIPVREICAYVDYY